MQPARFFAALILVLYFLCFSAEAREKLPADFPFKPGLSKLSEHKFPVTARVELKKDKVVKAINYHRFTQESGILSGVVQDEKGAPVGFATVAVIQATDAKIITGAITSATGAFNLKAPAPGHYRLRISLIGFSTTDSEPFEVTSTRFSKDFGVISLKQDSKMLKETVVQAMRPTITMHADKMVVSVEGTALAAGNTAYDVLARSPGVLIDQEGNIQLNGKGGIRMMLDGKLTYLSGKELQTLLQGMSAENLKDLEIISNPSAKYDAEGTAGIININLKKNTLTGVNGTIYIGGQYNGLAGYTAGGTFNYKKGKWSSFVNADMARRIFFRDATNLRVFNSPGSSVRFDSKGRQEDITLAPALRLGTDYDINARHSVGVTANLVYQNLDSEFITRTFQRNGNPEQDSVIEAINLIKGNFKNIAVNAHYQGKLDSSGTTLTADADYVMLHRRNDSRFLNLFEPLNSSQFTRQTIRSNDNPSHFNIFSAKTDLTRSFTKNTKLEIGLKASYVTSDNNLKFFNEVENTRLPDAKRTSHFIYKENINAAYVNFTSQLNQKWSLQSGLRAELTTGQGHLLTDNTKFNRSYLDWFPSLFLLQKVTKNYQVAYNYSRRISRPEYRHLNPFIFFIDPYTYAQGNANLRPAYTHSFEITQTLKNSFILKVGYATTKDFQTEIPEQYPAERLTIFRQANLNQFKNINTTAVLPFKITKKWDMVNNITAAYLDFTLNQPDQLLRNQLVFTYLQSSQNIQLPKNIRLEIVAGFQGPSAYGVFRVSPFGWTDLGLKRTLWQDKFEMALNVTDIFRSRERTFIANYNGNINENTMYLGSQSVRVNLRYRFNKGAKFDIKKRNNNLEESNRAGGN